MFGIHTKTHRFLEGESRPLFMSNPNGGAEKAGEADPAAEADKERAMRFEMEMYFAERTDIVEDDIRNYLVNKEEDRKQPLNAFEAQLKRHFLIADQDPDPAKVQASLGVLRQMTESINARNKSVQDRKKIRNEIDFSKDRDSSIVKQTVEAGKKAINGVWDAFNSPRATAGDKALMLGALAAGIAGVVLLLKKAPNFRKFAFWSILGVTTAAVAAEGGAKLFKYARNPEGKPQEKQIDDVAKVLAEEGIPPQFLKEIGTDRNGVIPVAGVLDMNVMEFLGMHQRGKVTKMLDPLPKKKIPEDKLTPYERFAIIDDIARTVGLVNQDGSPKQIPAILRSKSMLSLIMNYENNPLLPKEEKKEGGDGSKDK